MIIDDPRYRSGNFVPMVRVNEFWMNINMPGLKPIYCISNLGRVYSLQSNHILMTNIINSGYVRITLRTDDGAKDFLVHRLAMFVFEYRYDYENLQVNHKDGNKSNNRIENLEWCTNIENIRHVYKTWLYSVGEDHTWSILTDEQVNIICRGICARLSYQDISENLLGIEYTDKIKSIICTIRTGKNWKHISCNYKFPNVNRNCQMFTDDEIMKICSLIESGNDNNTILNTLDISEYSIKRLSSVKTIINRIRRKERFTRISQSYNI